MNQRLDQIDAVTGDEVAAALQTELASGGTVRP